MLQLPPHYKFPHNLYVGFSAGLDSTALLHFLTRCRRRQVIIAHFNHGTPNAPMYEAHALATASQYGIPIVIGRFTQLLNPNESTELQWARARHAFFSSFQAPVAIAHHLDDVLETWLASCLDGNPYLTKWATRNCIRPLLLNDKDYLHAYCSMHNLSWIEDPTNLNEDDAYRNKIRHRLVPVATEVNPGLRKILRKKLLASFQPSDEIGST